MLARFDAKLSFVRDESDLQKEWTLPFVATSSGDDQRNGALSTEGAKAKADATEATIMTMESFIAAAVVVFFFRLGQEMIHCKDEECKMCRRRKVIGSQWRQEDQDDDSSGGWMMNDKCNMCVFLFFSSRDTPRKNLFLCSFFHRICGTLGVMSKLEALPCG
jgi:hypothetical protein